MNLKCFDVSDEIFNKILYDFESDVIEIDELDKNSYYSDRYSIIYVRKTNQIICRAYILHNYCDTMLYSGWKQILLNKVEYTNIKAEDSIDGPRAWNYIMKILLTKYTRNEVETILTSYQTKPEYEKQYHYDWPIVSQNVQKQALCVKYDINGAHCDALCEMFPKCKHSFVYMYVKRHSNIIYKKYPNFFVGMLQHYGYSGAYWYIVDRTTKILTAAMDTVGGQLIYANTDGFCVMEPKAKLKTSDRLGDFKLEYEGDVYIYTNRIRSPYILYQFGDKLVGSCMTEARKDINLKKGIVCHYDRVKRGNAVRAENITKEQLCIE